MLLISYVISSELSLSKYLLDQIGATMSFMLKEVWDNLI